MADVLLKLRPLDPIVTEVPLVLRYDRKQGGEQDARRQHRLALGSGSPSVGASGGWTS